MAKRLTAIEKWNDPWFCGLNLENKLFWIYLCDNCNHAGIYKINWALVKFHIPNFEFDHSIFNGRIQILDTETWFLKKFVLFQQNINCLEELNPLNKCHLSIIKILTSKGLLSPKEAPSKGLGRGISISISKSISNKKEIVKRKQSPNDEEFIESLLKNQAYAGIDIARELAKMDNWLAVHKDRQKTKRFIINWLNKIDVPLENKPKDREKPDPVCNVCKGTGKAENGAKCFCWSVRR